ncbi:GATA-type zinc finger protein 1-like [Myotis yumanensis]|uniref:GATA-type zinc finger protein 1-like n=1 Tax=Myotis yumanensis TaxID=159337 RepID=UPI0038D40440
MMEAEPAPDLSMMLLRELLAPSCLDPEPLPGPPAQQAPRTPRCLRPSSSSFWPARQDSVTSLHLLRETAAGPPAQDTQARGPGWERKALGGLEPPPLARAMLTPTGQRGGSLGPPEISAAPSAPPRRRPRKQSNPHQGAEKVDPRFTGVTLRFQIKPDSSLQIIHSYSLASSSRSQAPPTGPEANPGGSEALGPRRCASCRTQRTPLWRDAEDGTPLCNACGIRYKKYGTRCSSCWLVPRKNVQPKKLCGRCGMFLGPNQGPAQEGDPRQKIQASGPRAPVSEVHWPLPWPLLG